jgi:CheY-like chemotaxis protein
MGGPPHVVVVEDQDKVRRVIVEALEAVGYPTSGFSSGTEALAGMDALAPALILLDLMMPGMSGLQFLDAVRASPSLAAIPVVIMSGLGTSFAGVERAKVAAIIPKPISFSLLVDEVKRIVGPPA